MVPSAGVNANQMIITLLPKVGSPILSGLVCKKYLHQEKPDIPSPEMKTEVSIKSGGDAKGIYQGDKFYSGQGTDAVWVPESHIEKADPQSQVVMNAYRWYQVRPVGLTHVCYIFLKLVIGSL